MESFSPQVVFVAKLPILNPNEFDLWKIRIEQYFFMTYYLLWEVILNDDSPSLTRVIDGVLQPVAPTTAEQKLARKNELKAREAIEKIFKGNTKTKKVQKTLLKQQYKNFIGSNSESLDQIHDKLRKLISQLEILRVTNEPVSAAPSVSAIDVDDLKEMDLKWQMAMLTVRARRFLQRTRRNLEANRPTSMGFDMFKVECLGYNSQVFTRAMFDCDDYLSSGSDESLPPSPIYDRSYSHSFNKWYQSLVRSFDQEKNNTQAQQKTKMVKSSSSLENKPCCSKACKKNTDSLNSNITDLSEKLGDRENLLYHYKLALLQVEARLAEHKNQKVKYYEKNRVLKFNVESRANCIKSLTKELELIKKEKEGLDTKLASFQTASKDLDNLLESQKSDKKKEGLGYSVVSPFLAQVYSPLKKDMSWTGLPEFADDTITDYSRPLLAIESTLDDLQNKITYVTKTGASDSTISSKPFIKFMKAAVKPTKNKTYKGKTVKKPIVKYVELYRKPSKGVKKGRTCPTNTHKSIPPRTVIHKPKRSLMRPTRPNTNATSRSNNARPKTTQYLMIILIQRVKRDKIGRFGKDKEKQRHVVPPAILTQSKLVPVTAARPVTTSVPKINVTRPRQAKTVVTKTNSPPRRYINHSPSPEASHFPPKVIAVKPSRVNAAKGMQGKWEWKPKCLVLDHVSRNTSASMTLKRFDYNDALRRSKGVIDSRCSRHMIGNMSYLSDFEELNGGYVAFGGNPKGGKISRKGKIRTGKLDFDDVYFVKELKFNLFNVS
nr:ribonuclease H-like domain-containing protein [Tanacetum cinerariifolium]